MAETDSRTRAGYAHRTAEGWVRGSGVASNARNRIERLVEDLNERPASEPLALDDRTRRQLEDLGYA